MLKTPAIIRIAEPHEDIGELRPKVECIALSHAYERQQRKLKWLRSQIYRQSLSRPVRADEQEAACILADSIAFVHGHDLVDWPEKR